MLERDIDVDMKLTRTDRSARDGRDAISTVLATDVRDATSDSWGGKLAYTHDMCSESVTFEERDVRRKAAGH
jgi:hypothetical protein